MRKATIGDLYISVGKIFQSPPSVRKATFFAIFLLLLLKISIPAFREEGDLTLANQFHRVEISIPAFREEGDAFLPFFFSFFSKFQSPPSVRKATFPISRFFSAKIISIPAFREEGDLLVSCSECTISPISIPAFREEGDHLAVERLLYVQIFQSPPSVRKATSLQVTPLSVLT